MAGHRLYTTGRPAANASNTAMPNVSSGEGEAKTSIAANQGITSTVSPTNRTRSRIPSSTARVSSVVR